MIRPIREVLYSIVNGLVSEPEGDREMRPEIVLFGDSITAQSFRSGGWGSALADAYSRKADVVVRGYGGYNTRWALFLLHHIFPLVSTLYLSSLQMLI